MIFPLSSFMTFAVTTGVLGLGLDIYGNGKKRAEEAKDVAERRIINKANTTIVCGRVLQTTPALWVAAAIAELATPVIGGIAISGAILLGLTHVLTPYFESETSVSWRKAAHSISQYVNTFVITTKVAIAAHPAVAVATFLSLAVAASRT